MNNYIDDTNLNNLATLKDIEKLCNEAIKYHFASVYVSPYYIKLAKELLKNSTVEVGTVIGFPLGFQTKEAKVYEAIDAVGKGADEIDMVINLQALKNKDYEYVKEEIEEIRDAIDGKVLKVIIESNLLTQKEIVKMTEICNETFVNFIKTGTGFNGDVKLEDVKLIKKHKNDILEIKASGGIRSMKQVEQLVEAGALRIGTSKGGDIMENKKCNCDENCECGCQDGKECTCDENCDCGCQDGKECTCKEEK